MNEIQKTTRTISIWRKKFSFVVRLVAQTFQACYSYFRHKINTKCTNILFVVCITNVSLSLSLSLCVYIYTSFTSERIRSTVLKISSPLSEHRSWNSSLIFQNLHLLLTNRPTSRLLRLLIYRPRSRLR
jgi:hypothetical protein